MKKVTVPLLTFVIFSAGFISLLSFFNEYHWGLDLLSHFRLQYLVIFLILFIISLVIRSKVSSLSALLFVFINLAPLIPYYIPLKTPSDVKGVVIYSANVSKENQRYDKLLKSVRDSNPDIVVLQEVNDEWMKALAPLKTSYPYHITEARDDYLGLTLMSRYPLINAEITPLGRAGVPYIFTDVSINKKVFTVIGIHPLAPFNQRLSELRNDHLEELATVVSKLKNPVVVIGDMNATPYSYPYRKFINSSGLKNCAEGFGYRSSWSIGPLLPPLGIRIDHCFHSPTIEILNSYVGEDIGSDHLPIANKISL